MSDVGLLIEASLQDAVTGIKKPVTARVSSSRDDAAPGFSFATAVSALEGRAAKSLEVHGATPQNASIGKSGETSQPEPSSPASNKPVTAAISTTTDPAAMKSSAAPQNQTTPHAPTANIALAPQIAQPAPQAITQANVAATGAVQAAPIAKADTALRPTAEMRSPATSKLARPEALAKAPPTVQDFAKLIARRLDSGASAFELRLDPPSLGRVDAQMKVADDGETKLSLKFDNQAALDMFSRDETDLRQSLADAGFTLDREHLELSLKDNAASERASVEAITTDNFASHGFSRGIIDFTI